MRRLLLDTQAFIWWDANDARLGGRARAAIQEAHEVYVSAVSVWEIVIKTGLGKLRSVRDPAVAVAEGGLLELPVTFAHAAAVADLPDHHRDPFDRLILATARVEGLTLLTGDEQLGRYEVALLDARR